MITWTKEVSEITVMCFFGFPPKVKILINPGFWAKVPTWVKIYAVAHEVIHIAVHFIFGWFQLPPEVAENKVFAAIRYFPDAKAISEIIHR